jgi:alpha-pyrone synthase
VSQPCIQSIGTAVPPHKISQQVHHSILENANGMNRMEKLQLRKIYQGSGINYRHSVLAEFGYDDNPDNILFHPANHATSLPVSQRMHLFEKYACDLCEEAATNCLVNLPALNRQDITHIITFSCTGMFAPGLDIQLVERLNLKRSVERTCINFMGCYAGINALKTAYHICRSQPEAVVLLSGVELCTLHYQKNEKQDQLVANAIFSDGAAAAIVSLGNYRKPESRGLTLENFYAEFEPDGKDEMVWRIGDFGFDLRLSAFVPDLINDSIDTLIQKLFIKANLTKDDINYYALHPGGMKILEACEKALQLTKEQNEISYGVLREYGNMSSVTIFFVLNEYLNKLRKEDAGKKILSCAFGPGLTMEAMIVEVI